MIKSLTILLLLSITFASCEIKDSYSKNPKTGMELKGDGLECPDVYLSMNDKKIERNTFVFGEMVRFNFNNIRGFKKNKSGAVYPKAELIVLDENKKKVMYDKDLFAHLKKGTKTTPLLLFTDFLPSLPHLNGEKYKIFINISDKKGKGTYSMSMPFTIIPNKNLKIESDGIDYSSVYLWDKGASQIITSKTISRKTKSILIIENLSGFQEDNGLYYPIISIECTDAKGNFIILEEDLIGEERSKLGITLDKLKQLPIYLTFEEIKHNNPLQLKVKIRDLRSDHILEIETQLKVN